MELAVVVASGERDNVDGSADPGGFQDVPLAVDGAEVNRDMTREVDEITWFAQVPREKPPARWAPELSGALNPAWAIT